MTVVFDHAFNEEFVAILLQWFADNARQLPWRKTYDPYHVWISEIMLQQTQMDRGVAYFSRWIDRFPDLYELAAASEQEVMKYWQGLGYYARARNLHKTAKILVEEMGGVVPDDYSQLIRLPGIGPYTAAAIASIAGNHSHPVVDANVCRVYARIFNIADSLKLASTRKRINELATVLLPQDKPRLYNQAIMDFGGVLCLPKNPLCTICPLVHLCTAFQQDLVAVRPLPTSGPKTVFLQWLAFVLVCRQRVFICQRPPDGVWGGLWEFPAVERKKDSDPRKMGLQLLHEEGVDIQSVEFLIDVQHQYTHHKIQLSSVFCTLTEQNVTDTFLTKKGCWVAPEDLMQFGFPAGSRKILEYIIEERPEILNYRL